MNTSLLPLAITSGEPAGIGIDICLALAQSELPCRCVILGDKNLFIDRALQLGLKVHFVDYPTMSPALNILEILHIPVSKSVQAGVPDAENASYVLKLLDTAYEGIQTHQFSGMVTAPVHKGIINDAGHAFTGHTEYLADLSHTKKVVMMLAGGGLRVALATTHLPLKKVADAINQADLSEVIQILHHDLQFKFGIKNPQILVAGLNPHAGEDGHLGREEIEVITPVLNKMRACGINVKGPFPADTLFQPFMLKDADAVLAMYHDQGLPVLKYASFGEGVNITLGLPFIRTSVDHGTALDLAGTGKARAQSLSEAIKQAFLLCAPKI